MQAKDVQTGLRTLIPECDITDIRITSLPGGASARTYHRVEYGTHRWVVMVLAEEPIRSEEAMSGPAPKEIPFVEVGLFLEAGGVPVPHIHLIDRDSGHLWLDDLGDTHLLNWLQSGGDVNSGYSSAIDTLIAFQKATADSLIAMAPSQPICYARRFEPALLRWELDHWTEWRVEAQLNTTLTTEQRNVLDVAFNGLVQAIDTQPTRLVHRDFQSTNLMATGSGPELTLIDYQDALVGPWAYDLVALLRDSYVDLSAEKVDEFVQQYIHALMAAGLASPSNIQRSLEYAFTRDFHRQVLQRKLKDAGRFVYIDRVKKNPWYLQYVERTMRFVNESLRWLENDATTPYIAELAIILRELDPESFS